MSRIGKLPIEVPKGVNVKLDGRTVQVQGPKGSEAHALPPRVAAVLDNGVLRVTREDDSRETRALHGLTRRILSNMVQGLSVGFTRTLEIIGVGYRAEVKGNAIQLSLGYSHPILYQLPPGVSAKVEKQTIVNLEGNNRQVLGEVAAQLRALRPPEPYKGKGIKYSDERIRRKAGKAAGAGGR